MRFILAAISGAISVAAFEPFGIAPLAVVSLTVLLLFWNGAGARQAFWLGFSFGLGQFGVGVSWVYVSLHVYGFMPPVLAAVAVAGFAIILSLFPAFAGWLQAHFRKHSPSVVLLCVIPTFWVLAEWLRSWVLTGFPWLQMGTSQLDWPLAGWLAIFGGLGVSWMVAFTAGVAVMVIKKSANLSILLVAALLWLVGALLVNYDWVEKKGAPVSVALVQGNIGLNNKWQADRQLSIRETYLEMSQATDAQLVVWPETALPYYLDQLDEKFWNSLRQTNKSYVFGLLERNDSEGDVQIYNAVVAVSGDQRTLYRKHHLVPFGEYLPLRPVFSWILDYLKIPMSDFGSWQGKQPALRVGDDLKAGVTICYEDAYSNEVLQAVPQANLLINVSEDAWFGDSLAPHQRLQIARQRAIEAGRPMLRAANTGVSAIIDHRGRISAASNQFVAAVVEAEVQPMQGATPYSRWHDWFLLLLPGLMLIGLWLARTVGGADSA